jgi:hypothetical protein
MPVPFPFREARERAGAGGARAIPRSPLQDTAVELSKSGSEMHSRRRLAIGPSHRHSPVLAPARSLPVCLGPYTPSCCLAGHSSPEVLRGGDPPPGASAPLLPSPPQREPDALFFWVQLPPALSRVVCVSEQSTRTSAPAKDAGRLFWRLLTVGNFVNDHRGPSSSSVRV